MEIDAGSSGRSDHCGNDFLPDEVFAVGEGVVNITC